MLVSILFQLNRLDCSITCIDNARVNSSNYVTVQLPLANGTLVNVNVTLQPLKLNGTYRCCF